MPTMLTELDIQADNGDLRVWDSADSIFKIITNSSRSESTCTELGWPSQGTSDTADCGYIVDINGISDQCSQGAITWSQANQACQLSGGRLATLQEGLDGAFNGTGCSHDFRSIWTSTPGSTPGTYYIVSGDQIDYPLTPVARTHDDVDFVNNPLPSGTNEIGIRCVADN
jgi:hypothetical protein